MLSQGLRHFRSRQAVAFGVVLIVLGATACGGGGGSSSGPPVGYCSHVLEYPHPSTSGTDPGYIHGKNWIHKCNVTVKNINLYYRIDRKDASGNWVGVASKTTTQAALAPNTKSVENIARLICPGTTRTYRGFGRVEFTDPGYNRVVKDSGYTPERTFKC